MASWPKNQNIKQKQYCKKFNKDFKNGPHQKKKKKKSLKKKRVQALNPFSLSFWFSDFEPVTCSLPVSSSLRWKQFSYLPHNIVGKKLIAVEC